MIGFEYRVFPQFREVSSFRARKPWDVQAKADDIICILFGVLAVVLKYKIMSIRTVSKY